MKPGPGPPEYLLEQLKRVLDVEAAEEHCLQRSTSSGVDPVLDHHSQTGLVNPPLGSFSTTKRTTAPSMTGRGPSRPNQAARRVSRGCNWSQACATALPKRRASATARRPRPTPVCRPQPSATAPRPRPGEARRRRSAPGRVLRTEPSGPDGVPARAPGRPASVPARPYTTARRAVRMRPRHHEMPRKLEALLAARFVPSAHTDSISIKNQHQGLCDSLPSPCQVALARIQHGRR